MSSERVLNFQQYTGVEELRNPSFNGAEKYVYEVIINDTRYAAKMYRDFNASSLERINKAEAARKEAETLLLLHKTALSPHLPQLHGLLTDESGEVAGLLVDWIEGEELGSLSGQRPLTEAAIAQLEGNLLLVNLVLQRDIYTPFNLIFQPGRNPELMIAEYKLVAPELMPWQQRWIRQEMDDLRRYYCI